jgi:hypothetical protein
MGTEETTETSSEDSETGDQGEDSETSSGDGDGDTSMGDGDGDSSLIQPGEPCDPLDAFNGIAPCAEGPEGETYTCSSYPVPFSNPVEYGHFCVPLVDLNNDGADIQDNCNDYGDPGAIINSCLNSMCMSNLALPVGFCTPPATVDNPNPDPYERCCTEFCDAEKPCGPGFKCLYGFNGGSIDGVPDIHLGACVDENF